VDKTGSAKVSFALQSLIHNHSMRTILNELQKTRKKKSQVVSQTH